MHEPGPRIRNHRRAGIGDKRHRFTGLHALHQPGLDFAGIVIVIGQQRTFDLVARQQFGGDARILTSDDIGLAKRVEGAERNVTEIADRRGDDEKSPPALARFT